MLIVGGGGMFASHTGCNGVSCVFVVFVVVVLVLLVVVCLLLGWCEVCCWWS